MKECSMCKATHFRKSEVCLKCSKEKHKIHCRDHYKRHYKRRAPCRTCGGKLGPEIAAASRYCSEACREKGIEKRKVDPIKNNHSKAINPKFLVRNYSGEKETMSTGVSSMNL